MLQKQDFELDEKNKNAILTLMRSIDKGENCQFKKAF